MTNTTDQPTITDPTQEGPRLSREQAMNLALKHHDANQLPQAERILRQILNQDPRYAPALHLLGVVAHRANQTELAVKLIGNAIAIMPNEPLFHSNRGEMCRILGRLDEAITHGNKAVELGPQLAITHSNLGIALYDKEDYDGAEACQKRALEIDPKCATALNNLGSIQRQRKDKEGSIKYYEKVLDSYPNFLESLNNLGAVLTEEERFNEALPHLLKSIQINPRYAEAHCNIGQTFLGLEQKDKALTAFNRAIELKPDYPEAYIAKARVLQEQNQLQEAEKMAEKAVALVPEKPDAHCVAGEVYSEMGFPDRAEQAFDKALELKEDFSKALNGKGALYLQMGKMQEAENFHKQALSLNEDDLLARIALTLVDKVQEDDNMAALVSKEDELATMPPTRNMALRFALGKCYDDTGNTNKAIEHLLEGNRIKRSKINYSPTQNTEQVDAIIDFFDEETLKRLGGHGDSSNMPIFVLGMPRSGTTLVEQIIASHPDVYGGGELPDLLNLANCPLGVQGTDFYPDTLKALEPSDFKQLGATYVADVQKRSPDAKRITDKMPANFFCIGLIHLMLPNAKIVHIKRNPVDTCLSGFMRLFNHGQYHSYNLTEIGQYYRNYARMMDHWRAVLPDNAFLDVQYEALVADVDNQARRIIDFCDLAWDDACLEFYKHKRPIRTASVTQVRRPIYQSSVARWKRYEPHLKPLLNALGDLVPKEEEQAA